MITAAEKHISTLQEITGQHGNLQAADLTSFLWLIVGPNDKLKSLPSQTQPAGTCAHPLRTTERPRLSPASLVLYDINHSDSSELKGNRFMTYFISNPTQHPRTHVDYCSICNKALSPTESWESCFRFQDFDVESYSENNAILQCTLAAQKAKCWM